MSTRHIFNGANSLKVLQVHNYYGSIAPSGENRVVDAEANLLRMHGDQVEIFARNSDDIRQHKIWGAIKGGVSVPWNPWTVHEIRRVVSSYKPDVVHIHNTFPSISPSVFYALGEKIPRVLTLHNYRLFCPSAMLMRDEHICTDCLDRESIWPSVRFGCYRGSRLATLPIAAGIALHRFLGTWLNQVDAFIVLSDFQKDMMIKAGLPKGKLHVKPNFCLSDAVKVPWAVRHEYAVFVGRLSSEKGIEDLIAAWAMWGSQAPELRIIGDGVLRPNLERQAVNMNIRFLGQLPPEQVRSQISGGKLLILPSRCLETFGLVVVEAFAVATPAAVSNIGPLSSIVKHGENGLIFEAGNPVSLLHAVRRAWVSPAEMEGLSQGASNSFDENYHESANYMILQDIYSAAIKERKLKH